MEGFANTYLCRLLRMVICQDISLEPTSLTAEEFDELLKLAKEHEVQPIAAYGLLLTGGLTPEQEQRCRKQVYQIMLYQERMDQELRRTCELLEQAQVDYMPLKGAVIRGLYPEPWLRTSGDVDILVKDADRAAKLLVKHGYQNKGKSIHDITVISPLGIPFELHFQLIDTDDKVIRLMEQVWDHARLREGICHYEMAPELFYFYHMAHMAKHMHQGGCGIRFVTDIWLLNHKISLNEEKRNRLLREGGLLPFARQAEHLSRVWFGDCQPEPLDLELENYILNSGVFGSRSNKVKLARIKAGTNLKYFVRRFFLPYDEMILRYPLLTKYPALMPVFWVRRWAGSVLKRRKLRRIMHELAVNKEMDEDAIAAAGRLFRELELV